MTLSTALHCITGFVAVTVAIAVLLFRYAGWRGEHRLLGYAVGASAAPAVIGLFMLPFFMTGMGASVPVILLPMVAVLFMAFAGAVYIKEDWRAVSEGFPLFLGNARFGIFLIAVLSLVVTLLMLSMPLIENDALEYAATALFLAKSGSLSHYPLTQANVTSGLYVPSLHPPVFHLALVWSQYWQFNSHFPTAGEAIASGFLGQRLIAVWSYLGAGSVVFAMALRVGRMQALFSLFLYFCIPFLAVSVMAYSIDGMRIGLFTAAAASLLVAVERPDRSRIFAAGLLAALAMWVHSIGVLAPAFGVLALLLLLPLASRWHMTFLYAAVALLAGGGWYLRNTWMHGVPLSDSWPVSTWPGLFYEADLAARRGLQSLHEKVSNGVLRPWTDPGLFGPAFWLSLAGGWIVVRRWNDTLPWLDGMKIATLWLGAFALVAFFSAASGSMLVIKNPRYWMTMAPLAALLGGFFLAELWQKRWLWHYASRLLLGASIIWTGASLGIRSFGLADPVAVFSGHETRFLDRPRFTGGPLLPLPQSPVGDRVLTFRGPETAIYGKTAWLDHFDPRLQSLHSAPADEAYRLLRQHAVRWAYLPDYSPVTHAHSSLGLVLADPRYSAPVKAHRNARLFDIHETARNVDCVPVSSGVFETANRKSGIGDVLASITGIPHLSALFQPEMETIPARHFVWSASSRSTLTYRLETALDGRFAAKFRLSGSGVVSIDAVFQTQANTQSSVRMMDVLLMNNERDYAMQWQSEPGARLIEIRLSALAPAKGEVSVMAADLCKVP